MALANRNPTRFDRASWDTRLPISGATGFTWWRSWSRYSVTCFNSRVQLSSLQSVHSNESSRVAWTGWEWKMIFTKEARSELNLRFYPQFELINHFLLLHNNLSINKQRSIKMFPILNQFKKLLPFQFGGCSFWGNHFLIINRLTINSSFGLFYSF